MSLPVPCKCGCGFSAFGEFSTCCTHCKGPDGPHTSDCTTKNVRVLSLCSRGCGRPPFGSFKTCCTRCNGSEGSHASDCTEKCQKQDTASPGPGAAAVAGGAGRLASAAGGDQPAFRPPARRCRKKALLIGINYEGTKAQLKGCLNDVSNVQKLLISTFGWDAKDIRIVSEKDATKANMLRAMKWLGSDAKPGDVCFFHYSGHGAQEPDPDGFEEDGMKETIIPIDFQTSGMITDCQINELIVKPLPEGARLTALLDCCHSGSGLDLPWVHTSRAWKQEVNPLFSGGDAQLFAGCEDSGTSADVQTRYGTSAGAMTTAFCDILRADSHPSYTELIASMNKSMIKRGFKQRPVLSSSQAFDFTRQFSLVDSVPNTNPQLGRVVTTKFNPRPKPRVEEDPLKEMLGMLAEFVPADFAPVVAAIGENIPVEYYAPVIAAIGEKIPVEYAPVVAAMGEKIPVKYAPVAAVIGAVLDVALKKEGSPGR